MIEMEIENKNLERIKKSFFVAIFLIVLLNTILVFQTRENSVLGGFDKKIVGTGVSAISQSKSEWLFTFLFSNCFVLLFYFAIKKYSNSNIAFFSSIVLIFSPTHLFFNSSFSFIFLIEIIIVLVMFLLSLKNKIWVFFGFFLLVCATFLNPIFLLILTTLTAFSIWRREEFRKTQFFFFLMYVITVRLYYLFFGGITKQLPSYPMMSVLDFLFEFSLIFGILLISLILAIVNFFIGSYNEQQKKIIALFLGSFAMIFISLYYVPFLNILISALCGATICFIVSRKWEILTVKVTTFFIIMLLLIYSSAQFFYFLSVAPPSLEILTQINSIDNTGFDFTTLASHPLYEVYIQRNCGDETFYNVESSQYLSRNFKEIILYWNNTKQFDQDTILNIYDFFYSRSIKRTLEAGKSLNISHVLITENMRRGLTWEKKEEGLLFVIRNKDVFERVRETDNILLIKINYDNLNKELD
jgi:hypothetical protein